MELRKIGSLQASAVGMGCMNICAGYGPADDTESVAMLQKAVDVGYTFFDTATMYGSGKSETLVGEALKSRRSECIVASKCGLDKGGIDGRPETIRKQCEASLNKLQMDTIDLYYLHRMDPKVPIADSVGELGRLVQEGKIREIGLSETSTETLKVAHAEYPIAALQSEYSLWSRTPERKILDFCDNNDIAFVPFSPLARGFLTGGAKDASQLPDNDLRCSAARPRFEPENFAKNIKLLEPFADIAKTNNCSMAQLGLAWLLAQRGRTMLPIPGTRSAEHMIDNAGAANVILDQKTVDELSDLINESTVVGNRYSDERMAEADAERD